VLVEGTCELTAEKAEEQFQRIIKNKGQYTIEVLKSETI